MSNHHIVHFKYLTSWLAMISQYDWKNKHRRHVTNWKVNCKLIIITKTFRARAGQLHCTVGIIGHMWSLDFAFKETGTKALEISSLILFTPLWMGVFSQHCRAKSSSNFSTTDLKKKKKKKSSNLENSKFEHLKRLKTLSISPKYRFIVTEEIKGEVSPFLWTYLCTFWYEGLLPVTIQQQPLDLKPAKPCNEREYKRRTLL